MVKVDLARRAEIGQEKRARTRATLVDAACALHSRKAAGTVTVDEVVNEAGVAKGTFYVHFDSLDALVAAVAEKLVQSFDELLQPARTALADPAQRIAFGCGAFIDKALQDPHWARIVARILSEAPHGAESARQRLMEDMRAVTRDLPESLATAELKTLLVFGIMVQVLRTIGDGQFSVQDRQPTIRAILRSIGLGAERVDALAPRLAGAPANS